MTGPIRKSPIAGSWYPGNAARLAAAVEADLALAQPPPLPGRLVALVSPHAGLRYSGPVAAHGYSLLRGCSGLTAVILGPSHRHGYSGVAVYARGGFETPLGVAPVDEELADALVAAGKHVVASDVPHRDEHSLEMQLPFLQHLVAELRIVPMLMGYQDRGSVEAAAAALAAVLPRAKRPLLLVASSDLSHYQPAAVANQMDALVVDDVRHFDAERLMARLEQTHEHACGGGPIVAVLRAARSLGANRATILRYADSGDAGERDKSRVVGYLSAALSAA